MEVFIVQPAGVGEVWASCVPLLEKAFCLTNGRYSPEAVRAYVENGKYQLFIAERDNEIIGCCTTQITLYPNAKWLSVIHCGGSHLEEWLRDGFRAVEAWARSKDCVGLEITGRKEWSRVLGFKATATKMELVL